MVIAPRTIATLVFEWEDIFVGLAKGSFGEMVGLTERSMIQVEKCIIYQLKKSPIMFVYGVFSDVSVIRV